MISNKLMAMACVMALSAAPAFAADDRDADMDEMGSGGHAMSWQFGELDSNRDQKITKQELNDKNIELDDFEQADSNGDGALDEQEFAAVSEE